MKYEQMTFKLFPDLVKPVLHSVIFFIRNGTVYRGIVTDVDDSQRGIGITSQFGDIRINWWSGSRFGAEECLRGEQ